MTFADGSASGGASPDGAAAIETDDALAAFVARSLDRPSPPEVARLAAEIARRPGAAAVLFYGNRLRDPSTPGLADLYVLTDADRDWSGPGLVALGARLLPPNVFHLPVPSPQSPVESAPPPVQYAISAVESGLSPVESAPSPPVIPAKAGISGSAPAEPNARDEAAPQGAAPLPPSAGAKVAVMRLAAFAHRMRRDGRDTTLWARFAQPAALLYARDAAAQAAVAAAVAEAWRTAAWWADRLADGPDRWAGLFAHTYMAELRPEGAARPGTIVARAPELYAEIDRLLPSVQVPEAEKAAARREWRRRAHAGRTLNAARLVKAAMTFRGGAAYALDKIQRHAGPDALSPWERRLPWLAAPLVLLRLLRRGGLR